MRLQKLKDKPLLVCLIALAAAILLELLLSNLHLISMAGAREIAIPDEELADGGEFKSKVTVDVAPGVPVRSVSFDLEAIYRDPVTESVTLTVYGTDENLSGYNIHLTRDTVRAGSQRPARNTVYLSTQGKASALHLAFEGEDIEYRITNLTVNRREGVSFNPLRLSIIVLIAFGVWFSKTFGLSKRIHDPDSPMGRRTTAFLAAGAFLAAFAVAALFTNESVFSAIPYPLPNPVENYNPFIQQFDALMKGRLDLDVNASAQQLAGLDNPYDYTQRQGIYYLWDRAFFDGKYYSYFGMAPLFVLYFPAYLITGRVPSDALVTATFAAVAGAFTVYLLDEIVKAAKLRISVSHFILGCVSCLFGSMIWLDQRGFNRFYYIACLAAMAFSAMFFYFFIKGMYGSQKPLKRRLTLAAAGLCYGLTFMSRVNVALLAAFIVLAVLIARFVRSKDRIRGFLPDLAVLAGPVILAFAVTFILNRARFGSFFEFGSTYQLTVSDVSKNGMGYGNILPAIYHYFFAQPQISTSFPFVRPISAVMNNYGHYVYTSNTNFGILAVPANLALLTLPFTLRRRSGEYRAVVLTALGAVVLIAVLDYSLGGVILRYVTDIAPCAAVIATVTAWELCPSEGDEAAVTPLSRGIKALFIVSVLFGFLLLTFNEVIDMTEYPSDVFFALKGVFTL